MIEMIGAYTDTCKHKQKNKTKTYLCSV